jgi:hypothetical protein
MLNLLGRLCDIRALIADKQYFVVHAPRQTGKTTTLESLAAALTAKGKYTALANRWRITGAQVFWLNVDNEKKANGMSTEPVGRGLPWGY